MCVYDYANQIWIEGIPAARLLIQQAEDILVFGREDSTLVNIALAEGTTAGELYDSNVRKYDEGVAYLRERGITVFES